MNTEMCMRIHFVTVPKPDAQTRQVHHWVNP